MSESTLTPPLSSKGLARRLAALPAVEMRRVALLRVLEHESAEEMVPVLAEIQHLGRKGGPPFDVALLALASALSHDIVPYPIVTELYRAAKEQGQEALSLLFFSANDPEDGGVTQPRDRDEQRELTLGHRKTMARSNDRHVLDRLLRDPEVPVIRYLLENPRLVERDVVQLAARRPTLPELQRLVFASSRWIRLYAVKRTLVLNPDTPVELALRLLGFLTAGDLRLVRQSPTLPVTLRQAAAQLDASRRG